MRCLGRCLPLRQAMLSPFLVTSWRPVSGGVGGGGEGSQTYYDYLDRFWNRQWFGATETLTPLPESSPFADLFVGCQEALGLEPAIAIILFGALSRLCTLYFSLYAERASERMRNAMQRLKAPHETFQRVYYREGSAALDIQLAATALKGERRRVFLEEKTSNLQCLSSLLGTPVVLFGLVQTTAMCENPQLDVGTSSFLWCPALTMSDPYGILPLAFCGLSLLNFELSLSKEIKNGWMSNIIWGARIGCVCILPAMTHIRAGVALYFLGMSLIGLLQPLLLRSSAFRKWFNFPSQQELEKTKAAVTNDDLHERMCVQFPYLTHLFNPESEENTGFLKQTTATESSKDFHSRRHAAGYSKEMNPTMREGPLRSMGSSSRSRSSISSSSVSPASSGAAAKPASATSRKGVNFAAGGWKTTQTEFREEDFIPEVGAMDDRSSVKGEK